MHAHNSHHQEKGRNIEKDQDGFQHVKSRKNIRRNILGYGSEGLNMMDIDKRNIGETQREEPLTTIGIAITVATQYTMSNG